VGMPTIYPKSNAGKYFVEFASSSTVHGLNHLVAPNRHPIEIFLAVLFIFGALLCLIFLSFLFWDRYQNNATVIVVYNDQDQFQILKPSIFICPVPNINLNKISDVFKKYNIEHTSEAEQFFTFLGSITYEDMAETPIFDKVPASKWLEILYDLKKDISPNILKENDPYEAWVVTERGLCFVTRNSFAVYATLSYWKNDNWTILPVPNNPPHYNYSVDGAQESLTVEHTALMLQRAIMSISAIETKPDVIQLSIQQRKCKFFNDGGLETWPVYTRNMCIMECRMKVIQDNCNCRPHFARTIEGINTCDANQLRCIGGIAKKLFLYEYPPSFCNCVPKCNVVSYQIRDKEKSELSDIPISSSVITLIVELPQIIYYRALLYGFNDFLSM
ncbi:hypothetical protein WN48_06132, partial [Eufriesea mexicana]